MIYRVNVEYGWTTRAQPAQYKFMVELTGAETLRIESFPATSNPTAFTAAAAAVYKR